MPSVYDVDKLLNENEEREERTRDKTPGSMYLHWTRLDLAQYELLIPDTT